MNITWHGGTSFRISSQKDKNNSAEISLNPSIKGIKKSDIVLTTEKEVIDKVKGDSFLISSPGEYEVKGIFVNTFYQKEGGLISIIEAEDIIICHLDDIKVKEIASEEIDLIGSIDILMIPLTIGVKEASQIISQIEPRIVVPMNFKKELNEFIKVMGVKEADEPLSKLSIKKRDVPLEGETKIIILENK